MMSEHDLIRIEPTPGEKTVRTIATGVRGVDIYHFPWISDSRGELTVGQFGERFPFMPKRYFLVFGLSSGASRGEHAHKACHQFLICAHGQCHAIFDDGIIRREVVLNSPNIGVYVPPMIWGTQRNYSADATLLVFASEYYEPEDYIHDYGTFKTNVGISANIR